MRYHGQGLRLTIDVDPEALKKRGLKAISDPFDAEHKRLFTFALPLEHEFVALRAVVQGRGIKVKRPAIARGSRDPKAAAVGRQPVTSTARACGRRCTTARSSRPATASRVPRS